MAKRKSPELNKGRKNLKRDVLASELATSPVSELTTPDRAPESQSTLGPGACFDYDDPIPPDRLVSVVASLPGGTSTEAATWVARFLYIPWSQIPVERLDTQTSFNLLVWAKKSASNENAFWTVIYPKTLASKDEIERHQLQEDDGRVSFKVIDKILESEGVT